MTKEGQRTFSKLRKRLRHKWPRDPNALRSGHSVEVLVDGSAAFSSMLDAIAKAEKRIWLETYIFVSDSVGKQFIAALAKRSRDGLEVLLLVDALGGLGLKGADERLLREAGVQVQFYGRFNHLRISRWIQRDHRKLLLTDQTVAFVGGINISENYAAIEEGGDGWHDIQARIRGPVCDTLARVFAQTWKRSGGATLHVTPVHRPLPELGEGELAMALRSNHRGVRMKIRAHLRHALRQAKSEVWLASAYFVPDRGLLRTLENTAKRGVQVNILVPGDSDVAGVQWASEHIYERLLVAGVRIHTWKGTHMHAKIAAIDRCWCMLGSYNLDFMSLLYSLELVVEIVGDETAETLSEQLAVDCAKSPRVDLADWRRRSRPAKFLSWLAYQFRHIL